MKGWRRAAVQGAAGQAGWRPRSPSGGRRKLVAACSFCTRCTPHACVRPRLHHRTTAPTHSWTPWSGCWSRAARTAGRLWRAPTSRLGTLRSSPPLSSSRVRAAGVPVGVRACVCLVCVRGWASGCPLICPPVRHSLRPPFAPHPRRPAPTPPHPRPPAEILPKHFGWPSVFTDRPRLEAWWAAVQADPEAARVIAEMRAGLADWEATKRWDTLGISAQVADGSFNWSCA